MRGIAYRPGYSSGSRAQKFRELVKDFGFPRALTKGINIELHLAADRLHLAITRFFRIIGGHDSFQWNGLDLRYYPSTSERAVEIPIALNFLEKNYRPGIRVLEVGNVLGSLTRVPRDTVDKYEAGRGVINADILEFTPKIPYNIIVAISTLEHVGFDEADSHPGKFESALNHLIRDCLSNGGRILVSLPLGYNREVDLFLQHRRVDFGRLDILARKSWLNEWIPLEPKTEIIPGSVFSYQGRWKRASRLALWTMTRSF